MFFKEDLRIQKDITDFLIKVHQEFDQYESCFNNSLLIVCYGLGKVSSCRIAQIQLAFLLLLRDHLKVEVQVYDPVFSAIDKKLLDNFYFRQIDVNEKGKRTVESEQILFYMPHCDFFLYNNLLWANWSKAKLKSISLIGNSFKTAVCDHISSKFSEKYKYVYLAEKFNTEYPFPTLKNNLDIFNNFAFMLFKNFSNVDDESFWTIYPEPTYSDDEIS